MFRKVATLTKKLVSRRTGYMLLLSVFALLASCKIEPKKNMELPDTEKTQALDAQDRHFNTDGTDTENLRKRRIETPNATTNGTTGGNSNIFSELKEPVVASGAGISVIYDKLKMSPAQIKAYEKAMLDYQKSLGGASHNSPDNSLTTEMENQLKSILSEEQLKTYYELKWCT